MRQGGKGRSFRPDLTVDAVKIAMEQIKIIHETAAHDEDFQKAIRLLQEAEAIYFLGFGDDLINMERIEVAKFAVQASGTGVGLMSTEIRDIQSAVTDKVVIYGSDCNSFLRQQVDW